MRPVLDAGNGPFVAPDVVTLVCRAVLAGGLLDGTQAGESAASSSVAAAMSRALASAKSDICILLSARITDPECTGAGWGLSRPRPPFCFVLRDGPLACFPVWIDCLAHSKRVPHPVSAAIRLSLFGIPSAIMWAVHVFCFNALHLISPV